MVNRYKFGKVNSINSHFKLKTIPHTTHILTLSNILIHQTKSESKIHIFFQDNSSLSEENESLARMLKEQQQVIKLALARIIPTQMTKTDFCEVKYR